MSWKTTFDGQFGLYDAQEVDVPQMIAGDPLTSASLPAPRGKLNSNCEQIMIQADENNPGVIIVCQPGTFPAGFRLAPGGSQVLPDNKYTKWIVVGTLPGKVTVNYVAGPK